QNQKHHHQERRQAEQPVERPANETPDGNARDQLSRKPHSFANRGPSCLWYRLWRLGALFLGIRQFLPKLAEPLTNALSATAVRFETGLVVGSGHWHCLISGRALGTGWSFKAGAHFSWGISPVKEVPRARVIPAKAESSNR